MAWSRKLSVDVAPPETPVIFEDEDEIELKLRFAAAIVSLPPEEWDKAGFRVFPGVDNYGRAMQAAVWISDPIVQIEIDRLRSPDNAPEYVPTEDEFVAYCYRRAQQETDAKAATGLLKLVAEAKGWSKTGNNIHVGDTLIQNVLRVPERARDPESFAARFKESQTKLVRDARSTRPE